MPAQRYPSSTGTSSRVPLLLEPHVVSGPLSQKQGSLSVLTWVQGASANWLVLRYLYALLFLGGGSGGGGGEEDMVTGVVLVSFLRDARFWAEGCMRLGMDLDNLRKSGRFSFVDGLTGLYTGLPNGDGLITGGSSSSGGQVDAIKTHVDAALSRLSAPARKILIVDGLDAYVAMAPAGSSASAAETLLMSLRENVYSTLLTLAADEPLMQAAVQLQQQQGSVSRATTTTATTLERNHAALVLGQAHAADQVISLRKLDTGAAADVSGVMRITTRRGGEGGADEGEELLYHVSGDGTVRVFERGS